MGPLSTMSSSSVRSKTTGKQELAARRIPVESDVRCLEVVGQEVWTGDRGGRIVIRKVRSGDTVQTLTDQFGANVWCLRCVTVAPPHTSQVWAGMSTGAILVFDPVTRVKVDHMCKHSGGIFQIKDSNGRAYSCSNDFEINEWKADTRQFVRRFSGHRGYVRCLLPNGPVLLSGSDDATIRIWDISTGHTVHVVQHHCKGVHAMVKVANEVWSTGGNDIVVWDLHTLAEIETLREHRAPVLTLQRVGHRVYSGGADHELFAWDIRTKRLISKFTDHAGWVYALCNTAKVVRYYMWSTATNDGCLQVWQHDEYHPSDARAKDLDNRTTDLLLDNPEAQIAECLQDTCDSLKVRCAALQAERDSYKDRVLGLEDELEKQNTALRTQLNVHQAITGKLADLHSGKIPQLKELLREKDVELDEYVSTVKRLTHDLRAGQSSTDVQESKVKELQRKVGVLAAEKEAVSKAHETHKQAHMKYIECNVDQVLKDASAREEALREQCDQLRAQLLEVQRPRRVLRQQENLEEQANRALAAGPPRKGEYPRKRGVGAGWTNPSIHDYNFEKYFASPTQGEKRQKTRHGAARHAAARGGCDDSSPPLQDRCVFSPQRPAPPPGPAQGVRRHHH
ncbi:Myosin heavy chain kinase B [Diplonema papillatum]|nr:Myosin heavy chain kinase B [Diplonema papillatum]